MVLRIARAFAPLCLVGLALLAEAQAARPAPSRDAPFAQRVLASQLPADSAGFQRTVAVLGELGLRQDAEQLHEFHLQQLLRRMLGEPPPQAPNVGAAIAWVVQQQRVSPDETSGALYRRLGMSFLAVERLQVPPGREPDNELPLGDGFWKARDESRVSVHFEVRNLTDVPIQSMSFDMTMGTPFTQDPDALRVPYQCHYEPPGLEARGVRRVVCSTTYAQPVAGLAQLRAKHGGTPPWVLTLGSFQPGVHDPSASADANRIVFEASCEDLGTCRLQAAVDVQQSLRRHYAWLAPVAGLLVGLLIAGVLATPWAPQAPARRSLLAAGLAGGVIALMSAVLLADVLHPRVHEWVGQFVLIAVLASSAMFAALRLPTRVIYPLLCVLPVLALAVLGMASDLLTLFLIVLLAAPAAAGLVLLVVIGRRAVAVAA